MIRILGALLALCLGFNSACATEPLSIEVLLAPPEFSNPKLSPDGRFYCISGRRGDTKFLATVDPTTAKLTPIATSPDADIIDYWWKGNGHILMQLRDHSWETSLHTIDVRTGKINPLTLFNKAGGDFAALLPDDSDHILITRGDDLGVELRRLNIHPGKTTLVQQNLGDVQAWLCARDGRPLAALGRAQNRWFMLLAPVGGGEWRRVELGEKNLPDFLPVAVAPDQRRILGRDYTTGDTASAVFWDPADDSKELVWRSDEVDPFYFFSWSDDPTATRAVAYETDHLRFHHLTTKDQALAREVDAALPDTRNRIVSTSADESVMIIASGKEAMPPHYFLFDVLNGRLSSLGSPFPALRPAAMASSRYFSFTARDGFVLHGRIHLPPNLNKPAPAVLFTGANFDERSNGLFNLDAQLFASRGYAFVQIDHRGVAGFGAKYSAAGNLQIAGAMVDDLADGVRWLSEQGLVDSAQVAVFSVGTGGHLALHALARYPEHFRVWLNLFMPLDLSYLDIRNVVFGRYSETELNSLLVGGKKAGENYLKSLDPEKALAGVKVPSFHYYPHDEFDNSLIGRGDRVLKHFKKGRVPYVFLEGVPFEEVSHDPKTKEQKKMTRRVYADLLVFLNKHLPVTK